MRNVKIIAAFGALAVLLAGASDALAQPDVVRARKELEITQIVIDKARRLVEESGNRRAEDPLRRAIDVQRQAAAELSGNGAHVSMRLTMIARDYAKRAAKLAAEPSENKEFVFRELQRTGDILRRAREELRESDDLHATDLLRTALERHEEAESSFRELQFRVALRLTVLARELAHKALDLSVGEPGAGPDTAVGRGGAPPLPAVGLAERWAHVDRLHGLLHRWRYGLGGHQHQRQHERRL